jgi:hypothetical protein
MPCYQYGVANRCKHMFYVVDSLVTIAGICAVGLYIVTYRSRR